MNDSLPKHMSCILLCQTQSMTILKTPQNKTVICRPMKLNGIAADYGGNKEGGWNALYADYTNPLNLSVLNGLCSS